MMNMDFGGKGCGILTCKVLHFPLRSVSKAREMIKVVPVIGS